MNARPPRPWRGVQYAPGDPALWAAVDSACASELRARGFAEHAIAMMLAARANPRGLGRPHAHERSARKALKALSVAVSDALELLRALGPQASGPTVDLLRRLAPELEAVARATKPSNLPRVPDGRAAIVSEFDRKDLGLPRRRDASGAPRLPDAREYAMLSLLAGNRPTLDGLPARATVTVADVVRREEHAIRNGALRTHGAKWVDFETGEPVDPPRGPARSR